jgi:hypothetical protein
MILVLALVTATLRPAAPKVGDLITVTFPSAVVLDASRDYEVVSHEGDTFVLRTFSPKPFALSGTEGVIRFRNLRVPVQSVLEQNDDLKPAPLVPPKPVAYPTLPFVAIGIAALCAIAAWLAVALRVRKKIETPRVVLSPADRFRAAVLELREKPSARLRWASLANEGKDLTTTELVPRLDERERIVADVLRQGDLEKFSPRGPEPQDFEDVTSRILEVPS